MMRYTFSRLFVLACTGSLLILFGCDQQSALQEPTDGTDNATEVAPTEQEKEINAALDAMAQTVALTLADRKTRKFLKSELEKKYTGAPETLYSKISEHNFQDGNVLQKRLARSYAALQSRKNDKQVQVQEALTNVKKYAAQIPKLHFAMPRRLGEWNAIDEAPLVSYLPVDKDEKVQKSFKVKAYDANGTSRLLRVGLDKVYEASSGEPVKDPIVVLGVNERTNLDGEVLPAYQDHGTSKNQRILPPGGGGGGGGGTTCTGASSSLQSGDTVEIYAVNVSADNEYVYNEPAEISYRVFTHSGSLLRNTDLEDGDPEPQNVWHECTDNDGDYIVDDLLTWRFDDYGDYIVVDWYKHDDSGQFTATFDYTFPDNVSISVGYENTNDNDPMGRDVMHKNDYRNKEYDALDIDWKTRW